MNTQYESDETDQSVANEFGSTGPADLTEANYVSAVAASNPNRPYQWYLDGGANGASNGVGANVDAISTEYTGKGVVVGIIDEGFDTTNPDLAGRFDLSLSYDPRDHGTTTITPDSSAAVHGTWVAGVLGASADNNYGIVGVAPDATLAGFYARFGLGGSSRAELADLLARQVNVDVSNNSWGYTTEFSDNFRDSNWSAVSNALHTDAAQGRDGLGTVMVFAAGNDRQYIASSSTYDGDDTNYHSLTNSRFVITTAASTKAQHIAPYSTPGASILVTAPGDWIVTTANSNNDGDPNNDFAFVSGTSFAAPIVSGVVAMMLEANPNLGYRDVQEILALSSEKIDPTSSSWSENGATNWNGGANLVSNDFGFGLIDAHAAVRLAETWTMTHTAANEQVISLAGNVGAHGALIDFQPNAYTVAVPTIDHDFSIDWVEVDVSIQHSHIGDLKIHLISPTGTDSVLMDMPADGTNSRADLNFTFSTDHDWGEFPAGTWTLVVEDAGTGGTGSLLSFAIRIYGDHQGADTTYYYTDDFATLAGDRGTIDDPNGQDTINAAAVTSDLALDLHPGAASTIAGRVVTISSSTIVTTAYAGDGNDTIIGNDAGDHLYGGHGNDVIVGGGGDDTIDGGAGADTMTGGAGNDTYAVDNAGDVVIENPGEGVDTVLSTVSYTLGANVENLTLLGTDNIDGTGNALDNVLVSNSGVDTLTGGDGNDTYFVHNSLDRVVELPGGGFDTVYADVDFALPDNIENMILTGGANLIAAGNNLDNALTSNAGITTLIGGGGDDTYYVHNSQDHVIEAANGGFDVVYADVSFTLSDNVETLVLTGSASLDASGNSLDNTITGNAGDNGLDGGAGADTMAGGLGNDTYFVDNAGDRIIEHANEGIDTVVAGISHTLEANVENLVLTGWSNIVGTGNDLDNVIISNAGIDTLVGGAGNDTYFVHNSFDHVIETSGGGNDIVYADVDFTLPENVETLVLIGGGEAHGVSNAFDGPQPLGVDTADGTGNINGAGNDLDNTLIGTAGDNVLDGGLGADTMIGGAGNDVYMVDHPGDAIVEYAGEGNDSVYAHVDYTLGANVENLILCGSDSLSGTGNDLDNVIIGNNAGDTIEGGGGNDGLVGGAGADHISGGAGSDWIYGCGGDDVLQGGTGNDVLFGGDGNDTLDGGDGDDFLVGDAGNDTINGGNGNNFMFGGDGDDRITGGDGNDAIAAGAGDDTVEGGGGINWIDGGDGNDVLRGGNGSNALFGGAGDDLLQGGDGVDGLAGGAGNDTLIGGAGDDWLYGGEGNDTLLGGAGNDVMIGGEGDDRLVGGEGTDFLAGGAGADTFVFNGPAEGGDVVCDFTSGLDVIEINAAGFGLSVSGALPDVMFASGDFLPADFDSHGPIFYADQTQGALWFDATGGSSVDAVLIAGFVGGPPAASDFHLV